MKIWSTNLALKFSAHFGGHYRLIVAIAYRFQAVYIKFIGTPAEYDKIDAATVEHTS